MSVILYRLSPSSSISVARTEFEAVSFLKSSGRRYRYLNPWRIIEQKVVQKVSATVLYYRNDPKFLDRYAWANSADPDQTAPRVFAILSASFGLIALW